MINEIKQVTEPLKGPKTGKNQKIKCDVIFSCHDFIVKHLDGVIFLLLL